MHRDDISTSPDEHVWNKCCASDDRTKKVRCMECEYYCCAVCDAVWRYWHQTVWQTWIDAVAGVWVAGDNYHEPD